MRSSFCKKFSLKSLRLEELSEPFSTVFIVGICQTEWKLHQRGIFENNMKQCGLNGDRYLIPENGNCNDLFNNTHLLLPVWIALLHSTNCMQMHDMAHDSLWVRRWMCSRMWILVNLMRARAFGDSSFILIQIGQIYIKYV